MKKEDDGTFQVLSGTYRKLRRWEREGLIGAGQREAILAFEKQRHSAGFVRGLTGVGLLAIVLGVLSIVAANWAHIPGGVKIGVHFLLNMAAAGAVWKFAAEDRKWPREGALALLFGLNLTLIALIGQVFQLSGSHAGALALWMVISTPALFLFGRGPLTAGPWIAGFIAAVWSGVAEAQDHLPDLGSFLLTGAAVLYLPLALMAAGAFEKIRALRPVWLVLSFRAGMALLALSATLASLFWYADTGDEIRSIFASSGAGFGQGYIAMLTVALSAPVAVYLFEAAEARRHGPLPDRAGIIFVIGSLISIIMPPLLMGPEIEVMAAIHFIAYAGFIGWLGRRIGNGAMVSWSINLITLRLIIVYLELFGGLLATGFGLIGSGVLLLGLLHAARKVNTAIRQGTQTRGDGNAK